jgi:hypothetical protein
MNRQSTKSFEMRTLDSHSRVTRESIPRREAHIQRDDRERRVALGEEPDVIDLFLGEDESPDIEEYLATQSVQLLALTRELEEYNNTADCDIEGPEFPVRFITSMEEVVDEETGKKSVVYTYGQMDSVDTLDVTTPKRDTDEDNDDDLVNHLNKRIHVAGQLSDDVVVVDHDVASGFASASVASGSAAGGSAIAGSGSGSAVAGSGSGSIARAARSAAIAAAGSPIRKTRTPQSTGRVPRSAVPTASLPVRAVAAPPTPPPGPVRAKRGKGAAKGAAKAKAGKGGATVAAKTVRKPSASVLKAQKSARKRKAFRELLESKEDDEEEDDGGGKPHAVRGGKPHAVRGDRSKEPPSAVTGVEGVSDPVGAGNRKKKKSS